MIIKCKLIPRRFCVNLFGTIWTRDTSWIDRYVINRDEAYLNISFEREAYTYGHDLSYLRRRRHYAWIGRIKS